MAPAPATVGGGLMPPRAIHFGSLDFVIDQATQQSAPRVLPESTILTSRSFIFWIDEALVARLEQPALHSAEEPKPRQSLEISSAFHAGNIVHQFVGVIDTESIFPVLDCESAGYESSGSQSTAAEVFVANTTEPTGARAPPQPTESEAARAQQHE